MHMLKSIHIYMHFSIYMHLAKMRSLIIIPGQGKSRIFKKEEPCYIF